LEGKNSAGGRIYETQNGESGTVSFPPFAPSNSKRKRGRFRDQNIKEETQAGKGGGRRGPSPLFPKGLKKETGGGSRKKKGLEAKKKKKVRRKGKGVFSRRFCDRAKKRSREKKKLEGGGRRK